MSAGAVPEAPTRAGRPAGAAWPVREASVVAALGVLLALLAVWAPNFFEPQPLLSRLTAAAPRLLLACGAALVILTRQIDISTGSLFAVCGTAAGLTAAAGAPLPVTVAVALAAGAGGGLLNGILVAGLGLPSIVVTLALMVTLREGLRLARQGVFVNLPEGVQWFGGSMGTGQAAVCLTALALWAVLAWGLRHLAAGRHVHAVGSDAEAARLAGIRPGRVTFTVFVLSGLLTGIAATLHLVQSPQVDPNGGRGLELEAIAAAVVGGVAISGGRGRLWGVLAGLLLLTAIGPALTYLGVKPYWEKALQGAIILLAVVADGFRGRTRSGS